MTPMIANPYPEASLTIPLTELGKRKPQSLMIRILLTMAKSAAVPLEAKTANELTVAEMLLSYINQQLILNPSLKNTNLVPIT